MISIIFGIFFLLLFLGAPIGISVGIATLSTGIVNPAFTADATYVFRAMVSGMDSYVLLAVPLFMLSSTIMSKGGLSDRLFDFFSYFFGHFPAGLPIAVVITCLFYGAICGSGPATVAAIGTMAIPLLVKLGYEKNFTTAMIAVAGGLGVIIPPSIPFITYGLATGTSVGDLFIAGFLPGVLIALCFIVYLIIYFIRNDNSNLSLKGYVTEIRKRGFLSLFKSSFFALLAPVIILGGIYSGIVTPTEAAGVSVVYAAAVCILVFRSMGLKDFWQCLIDTARMATPVMFILATCIAFGRILTLLNIPQTLSILVTENIQSKILLLLIINLFLLVVGMIMDTAPAILIVAPILLPIVQRFGMDPVHFGIMMTVNLAIGFVTPPIGTNLFVANSLTGISIMDIAKKALPFIGMFLVALMLITYIPEISLVLVRILK